MPSSTERNTKRRKRAAAALGIILAIVGGLAYATARDGEAPTAALPSPPASNIPTGPDSSTEPDGASTDTAGTDGADASPAAKRAVKAPAAKAPTLKTPGTPVAIEVDTELETSSRNNPPPLTPAAEVATDFAVTGSPAGDFRPGVSQPVDVTISNPHDFDLTVTAITVSVGPSSVPACGAGNMTVTQNFSGSVVVPAGATRSLSALHVPQSQWPVITMPDTAANQDACQQATFPLTYTGTGSVPS
jgi:hypothetical protein